MVQAFNRRTTHTRNVRQPIRQRIIDTGAVAYDATWRRLSAAFIQSYPFCVLCLCHGKVNQGAQDFVSERQRNLVVDHIVPHGGDSALFWEQDTNWQTLCRTPCHDRDKKRIELAHKDWFAHLRSVIDEKSTMDFVLKHKQWIPPHVIRQIAGER